MKNSGKLVKPPSLKDGKEVLLDRKKRKNQAKKKRNKLFLESQFPEFRCDICLQKMKTKEENYKLQQVVKCTTCTMSTHAVCLRVWSRGFWRRSSFIISDPPCPICKKALLQVNNGKKNVDWIRDVDPTPVCAEDYDLETANRIMTDDLNLLDPEEPHDPETYYIINEIIDESYHQYQVIYDGYTPCWQPKWLIRQDAPHIVTIWNNRNL